MGTASQEDAKQDDPPHSGKHCPLRWQGSGGNLTCLISRFTISGALPVLHLAALGVDPVVAERCLNHRIKGVEGYL
jgi:hypothetical protein